VSKLADVFLNASIQVEDFDENWFLPPCRFCHFFWGKLRMGKYDCAQRIYFIERVPSLHLLVKHRSYGVSTRILNILRSNGCEGVHLSEKGKTGVKEWGANLMLFYNAGIDWQNTVWPKDKQKQLPLHFWTELSGRWKPEDFLTKMPVDQCVLDAYPGST
jgi:hypothetical protein